MTRVAMREEGLLASVRDALCRAESPRIAMVRPCTGEEEKRAVSEVLDSGILAQGPAVRDFEKAFAAFCGVEHAVAVANGTLALHAALLAAGVGEGAEVVTTPFSFIATANAVLMAGARPVFADVDPVTLNLDPESARSAVTPDTCAILVVHLYGRPCPMDAFRSLAQETGARLIEDACQAHGAEHRGRRAGALGDMGCFSFYATKNMTCGEGGMITTDDGEAASRVARLRFHGQEPGGRYVHRELGYNYRLTDVAASIGLCQLAKLPAMNGIRAGNAAIYDRLLGGLPGLEIPVRQDGIVHAYHQYTVRIRESLFGLDRDGLARLLRGLGVETGIHYPLPLHIYPQFRSLGYAWGDFPRAEQASREVLSLPVGPHLGADEVEYVAACIREVARRVAP